MSETRSKIIDAAGIKKALIVLPNWIGDAVMAVPAISGIRDFYPSAHVAILGLPHICELFQESPYIDETRVYSKSLLATVNDIKKYDFDLAILLPNSFRSALLTHLARIPLRCGYNRDGRGFMLNMPVKVDSKVKRLHQAEYYLNLIGKAFSGEPSMSQGLTKGDENPICHPDPETSSGVSGSIGKEILKQVQNDREAVFSDEPSMFLRITNEDENHPSPFPLPLGERVRVRGHGKQKDWLYLSSAEHQCAIEILHNNDIHPDSLIIGINPGAAYGSAKRWYPERFARLGKILANKYNAKIIVFGGKQEQDTTEQIVNISQVSILNMAGKTSVRELMAIIKHCRVFVTNDSGPMHIAAALGVPVVAIFGSTDPSRTGPLGDQHIVIKKDIECSPCFLRKCHKDLLCMNLISVDDVMEGVKRILKSNEQ